MRIPEKILEIENYLLELSEFVPHDFQEYEHDFKTRAACERYPQKCETISGTPKIQRIFQCFEKIVEAVVDLTFLIIKDRKYKIPEEDKEAFDILVHEEVISQQLSEKLKDAKGMRNIIAHKYGRVDDELVFHSITEELDEDVRELLDKIRGKLE